MENIKYRKEECPYCKEASSISILEATKEFFWDKCKECDNIIVIYKWHNEPTDNEIKEVLKWVKENFPNRAPDFRRKHVRDHFSFELVFAKGQRVSLKSLETFIECPICNRLVSLKETKNTLEGIPICQECYSKAERRMKTIPELENMPGTTEDEKALALAQFQDEDDIDGDE